MTIRNWIYGLFDSKGRRSRRISEFCHYNKDLLVIVADPKTDNLFMSYRDKIVANQIKNAEGFKTHVVKGVLSHSLFKKEVDNFLTSIMDSLQLSLEDGNQFYQWIDGALYNIAKVLRLERKIKNGEIDPEGDIKIGNVKINNQQDNKVPVRDYSTPNIPVV